VAHAGRGGKDVNTRDQAALIEIYEALNQMTALQPLNPMDVRAVSANLLKCTQAASDLMYAVFHLRIGEHAEAKEYAADALATLAKGRG
jgi:hypothetical protein